MQVRKGTAYVLVGIGAMVAAFFIGKATKKGLDAEKPATVAQKVPAQGQPPGPAQPVAPRISEEVHKIPVGNAPTKGGKQPKVTIITFSEFQCPFCSRVVPTMAELVKTFGDDVQIAFKHFPLLQMHPQAMPAALAAEAAREQGKFWEMHDLLFANQQALDAATIERHAQQLGLDMPRFKASIEAGKGKAAIEADMAEATRFGVTGTPSSFVNGRAMKGAQVFEAFKMAVADEIKKADEKLKAGVARANLYSELIKGGLEKVVAPPRPAAPAQPAAGVAYKVDVGKAAPFKGAKDALVTIVQFSDYQCPFCTRVEPTMNQVMETYKGKVRVVWKDLPLPFHAQAKPAAIAARAAGEQGKFWEMHGKLFANQQALDNASLERYAQELGLNMDRFKASLASPKLAAAIDADLAQAQKLGANGTPAFFVNGVSLTGAQPFEQFKTVIDAELAKAEALVAKGTPKSKVYDAIMKTAKTELAAAPAPAGQPPAQAGPEADPKVWKVEVGDSPSRGPKNAPITLVIFSDYECPFCTRVEPTIKQVEKEYPGKVRVVWKDAPLPFHANAKGAAAAARAAGEQGKFWEMHDKLFENQKALTRPSLEQYAQQLGLDLGKFKAALDSNKFAGVIEADMKHGATLDVQGTPATFINGRKIGGAYPYETFKKIVEQELSKDPGKTGRVAARRKG